MTKTESIRLAKNAWRWEGMTYREAKIARNRFLDRIREEQQRVTTLWCWGVAHRTHTEVAERSLRNRPFWRITNGEFSAYWLNGTVRQIKLEAHKFRMRHGGSVRVERYGEVVYELPE